ncbi:MAG TPA: hypothetical protein VIT65_10870 [Microlunatus sp.]
MNARKAAVAIIAGLATATTLGAVDTAVAAPKDSETAKVETTEAVPGGKALKATEAKAPRLDNMAAPSVTVAQRKAGTGSVTAAVTRNCYAYSNGTGDLCLWYYQNYTGSRGGSYGSDANLSDNYFASTGSGQNQSMTNNSESTFNYDYIYTSVVWTNNNYTGTSGTLAPRAGGNWTSTYKNNVQSLYWS